MGGRFHRHWREGLAGLALLVVVLGAMSASGWARAIDSAVYRWVVGDAVVVLPDSLVLLDLPYPEATRLGDDPGPYRAGLARLLQTLADSPRPPRQVVLDIWFGANPAGEQALAGSVRALQARGVRVWAALNVLGRHGELRADFRDQHNRFLYEQVFDGAGHTLIEHRDGLLSYRPVIEIPTANGLAGTLRVRALAPQVAGRATAVDETDVQRVFPYRRHLPPAQRVTVADWRDGVPAGPGAAALKVAETLVIGSLDADSDNVLQVPGPILVAYAIAERMGQAEYRLPLNRPLATVSIIGLTGAAALGVFVAGFRKVRRRAPVAQWSRRAIGLAVWGLLAACVAWTVLFQVLLAADRVAPLALPVAGAAVISLALWAVARRQQSDAALQMAAPESHDESAIEYDVFISYAHEPPEHLAWVRKHIVAPISALRRADGQAYRVFFDERSIRPGRQWKREIELALLGSRRVVPVFTAGYFERAYCREELEIADQLRIEGRLNMVPVVRGAVTIPERYRRKFQYIDAGQADFVERLLSQLTTDPTTESARC